MPHKFTSLAMVSLSISNDGNDPYVLNVTQGHKLIYTTSYISIPNDADYPTWLYQGRVSLLYMPHKDPSLAIQTSYKLIPN